MAEPSTPEFDLDEPDADAPPESAFWQTYSPNLEFPIAGVVSAIVHVGLVAGLFILLTLDSNSAEDKSPVPISLVDTGGYQDVGDGSSGSGGDIDPLQVGAAAPTSDDFAALPLNDTLPEIKQDMQRQIALENPLAQIALSDEKAAELALLDKSIRDKLIGSRRGNGGEAGSGDTGQEGAGPGGFGADETRARGLRWVIRFRTTSGQNYLEQLRSLGAIVVVPTPPDFKTRMYIFRDLNNPTPGVVIQPSDWDELSDQIRFCDLKETSGRQISTALNLPYTAPYFWAFFPKGLEDELARKETSYQNRRAEDIEETVFQAVQRGGKFDLDIARQTVKR